MSNNKIIGGTAIAILLVGGFMVYKRYDAKKNRDITKSEAIDVIVNSSSATANPTLLNTFEEGYLKAWAKAIVAKDTLFTWTQKQYKVIGGKSA